VSPGDLFLAVNGRPVDAVVTPASLLVNQAGLAVELTVARSDGQERRNVVVTTLRDEQGARYREWAAANRTKVHEVSGGQVAMSMSLTWGLRAMPSFTARTCPR
jgi:C-terminal processing protease CtpA/Prc